MRLPPASSLGADSTTVLFYQWLSDAIEQRADSYGANRPLEARSHPNAIQVKQTPVLSP
jgi:hypothetical protein